MNAQPFKGTAKQVTKADYSFLREQVAWMITVFLRVRGNEWLFKPETSLLVRKSSEAFFIHDLDGIENRENVLAVVCLKDIECFEEFKTIQADHSLRVSALGQMALNYLADQLTAEVVHQARM